MVRFSPDAEKIEEFHISGYISNFLLHPKTIDILLVTFMWGKYFIPLSWTLKKMTAFYMAFLILGLALILSIVGYVCEFDSKFSRLNSVTNSALRTRVVCLLLFLILLVHVILLPFL